MSENISDALKMAAALLLFVMALSVAMFAFSKAKKSAELTMKKLDGTFLYYDTDNIYLDYMEGTKKTTKITIKQQAIIDKSQFLVNLFNYYTSGYTLLFYYADATTTGDATSGQYVTISNIQKLPLYFSEASPKALNRSILRVNPENFTLNPDGSVAHSDVIDGVNADNINNEYRAIYGLDITDEISRQEPWIYNDAFINKFVEDLVMAYVTQTDTTTNRYKAQPYTTSARSKLTLNVSEPVRYIVKTEFPNHYVGEGLTSYEYDKLEPAYKAYCESFLGAYKYWFKYAYTSHTGSKSFMDQDCRFVQRIGTYNYESSSTIQSTSPLSEEEIEDILSGKNFEGISSLTDVDASEDLLSNGQTIDNYGGTEKKIVQYVYIGTVQSIYN